MLKRKELSETTNNFKEKKVKREKLTKEEVIKRYDAEGMKGISKHYRQCQFLVLHSYKSGTNTKLPPKTLWNVWDVVAAFLEVSDAPTYHYDIMDCRMNGFTTAGHFLHLAKCEIKIDPKFGGLILTKLGLVNHNLLLDETFWFEFLKMGPEIPPNYWEGTDILKKIDFQKRLVDSYVPLIGIIPKEVQTRNLILHFIDVFCKEWNGKVFNRLLCYLNYNVLSNDDLEWCYKRITLYCKNQLQLHGIEKTSKMGDWIWFPSDCPGMWKNIIHGETVNAMILFQVRLSLVFRKWDECMDIDRMIPGGKLGEEYFQKEKIRILSPVMKSLMLFYFGWDPIRQALQRKERQNDGIYFLWE